ncbi:hypothetical protein SRHO_G00235720 [Serrasalmus rhombeus]
MASKMHFSEEQDSQKAERLVQGKRSDPPEPSCVSMKSDQSMGKVIHFREEHSSVEHRAQRKNPDITKRNMDLLLKLEDIIISLVKNQLKSFVKLLSLDYPACSEREMEEETDESIVREGVLKITLSVLRNMNQTDLANTLQTKLAPSCHLKMKSTLKENFQKMNKEISSPGNSVLLNETYTELYITQGGSGEVSNEHEVRQIETASRRPATQEKPIKCNDLFKDKAIRTVLTKGVAGIGKTVSVQKFILDWAEGKTNQDVLFIFPLPFRELNLMKEKKLSLVELLDNFFSDTKELKPRDYCHYKVMFIFDGLDECQLPLNFQNNESIFDLRQSASVDVLLTNLIKGNLLPSAHLWITTRPAAANQIPPEYVNQITEVQGFSDPQKEEYFQKKISDHSLAERIVAHIKSSRSLYIMCHIPVFCWIAATVLERVFGEAESAEIPKTLTQMFSYFLIFQIKHSNQKYQIKSDIDHEHTRKIFLALGKLAFHQLEKGNLIFYEEDLKECGIEVREVSVYSGVCTQIFREELGLHLGKVFSFVHLSVQEFLAALYVFVSFISNNTNVLLSGFSSFFRRSTMFDFFKSAVDKALQKEKLNEFDLRKYNPSEEFLLKLLPVVKASRKALLAGCNLATASCEKLSSALQSANCFLKELDLSNNDLQDSGVELLSAEIKSSHCNLEILILSGCMVTDEGCCSLASALKSNPSHLRELDLTYNDPGESGVKLLSDLLKDPHYALQKLRMDHGGKIRMKPGVKKYVCDLTLDPNTVNSFLSLSQRNRKVVRVRENQHYPDHPDRFDYYPQVLSMESLTGRCYWEVQWSGHGVDLAVSYRGIKKRTVSEDCVFGYNNQSWSLFCSNDGYFVRDNKQVTTLPGPLPSSNRIGVYLDWESGTLSFYTISPNTHTLTHLHTFITRFTEPLHAGFRVYYHDSSVSLCEIE